MNKELVALHLIRVYLDTEGELEMSNELNIIETALKDYQQYEEIVNDYGLTLVDFRKACLLLAMLKGDGRNIHNINNQLKALEIIRTHKLLNYVLKNEKCANMYHLSKEEEEFLREVLL